MSSQKKELVVVEPMPPEAAKERFIEWRGRHPEIASRLGQQDLILDVILRNKVEPGGAANGSQPIRSETNQTSAAAGSRR